MDRTQPNREAGFRNLDENVSFENCSRQLQDAQTSSFAVRFSALEAVCVVDPSKDQVLSILDKQNRPGDSTVWLNFWGHEQNRDSIKAIAAQYEISPRLVGLMCPAKSQSSRSTVSSPALTDKCRMSLQLPTKTMTPRDSDVERTAANGSVSLAPMTQKPKVENVNFMDIINNLWHFHSVDPGRRSLYIGYNSLFYTDGSRIQPDTDRPAGCRVWTSLLILDDGTVVSIFERPPPEATRASRQNVLNIFRHLSRLNVNDDDGSTMMKTQIRAEVPPGHVGGRAISRDEQASLLFYYIFDDWLTTLALIAGLEHPYRRKLEEIRRLMKMTATVELVDDLHRLGRQLTILNSMYQSLEQIVSRLIQRDRLARSTGSYAAMLNRQQSSDLTTSESDMSPRQLRHFDTFVSTEDEQMTSIRISSSAIIRFERLLTRIRLYALTEIEECLKEKESLVLVNFNLVALKEAQAVEKLTRTTIVLAKATILFLPVSLMTGYFSIQVGEIQEMYSLKTYWICFLVVALLSILFLILFGISTNTIEGKTVYRSMAGMAWDKSKTKHKNKTS